MTPYSFNINVCKNSHCEILNELKLEKGVIKSRIFAMDSCHIGIAGGVIKENGVETISSNLDIANICTQKWIYSDLLPIALSEFGLIETNDYFCLYGGITFDDETDLPQISQLAYCTTCITTFLALILCKIFKKRHEINRTFVPQDTPSTHVQLEMIKELNKNKKIIDCASPQRQEGKKRKSDAIRNETIVSPI